MRRFIFNLVSVLFSAVKFGIMKLFHFHHFFYSGIQRFSPNTEVVIAEGGTIRLGRHVRAHRRSKLLAMDGGVFFPCRSVGCQGKGKFFAIVGAVVGADHRKRFFTCKKSFI